MGGRLLLIWGPLESLFPRSPSGAPFPWYLLTRSVLGCSRAVHLLPPTFLPGARISRIRFPDSQAPGSHLPAAALAPGETSTPRRGHPLTSETHSWACRAVGLLPRPEPGTLVSPGHGKAWVLGPTQEASLASGLKQHPQGHSLSSLSLALRKSGLVGSWHSWASGGRGGPCRVTTEFSIRPVPPRGLPAASAGIGDCSNCREQSAGIWWPRAKCAAQHPQSPGQSPPVSRIWAPRPREPERTHTLRWCTRMAQHR